MGEIAIRVATIDDLAAMQDVFRRASLSNESDRPLLEQHPEWLVLDPTAVHEGRSIAATDDEVVVGFASTSTTDGLVELEDLFVDPDRRRAGHARRLVERVAADARADGSTAIEVTGNDHARAFYEAAGFVPIGMADTEGHPAVRMRRSL